MTQFETLAQRLKYARKAAGLTQDELADWPKISRAAISQYESGETLSIKSTALHPICKALGIESEWLVHGTGEILVKAESKLVSDNTETEMEYSINPDVIEIILELFQSLRIITDEANCRKLACSLSYLYVDLQTELERGASIENLKDNVDKEKFTRIIRSQFYE